MIFSTTSTAGSEASYQNSPSLSLPSLFCRAGQVPLLVRHGVIGITTPPVPDWLCRHGERDTP
ncbi:MAG TPA: hypothetical protein PKL73_09530 [Polyangiaceae bacterium]|nr:hypothetical protein [Polyangiaceae bacterium]HNZ23558.1 hypothetical protein [Polyangiaceae bacterium]HOD24224.1 hypothetical protein [Polyangiaceae bacterium]HOE51549.1 hypothetical protein [Polyangiaceae bacterium]HOH01330.1 hypothetical protein [Polyangiaceae bacterium]